MCPLIIHIGKFDREEKLFLNCQLKCKKFFLLLNLNDTLKSSKGPKKQIKPFDPVHGAENEDKDKMESLDMGEIIFN